jgi:membrane protein implicated in regulation of membrane protease activity
VVHVSWWIWAIVAWLVVSVPFAVFTAKFIAAGRERPRTQARDEALVDLVALEAEEAAEAAKAEKQRTQRPKRALRAN